MPLATPVTGLDGQSLSEVFVPNGTPIIISVININRSTKIWGPDAKEWKPERWLNPLPETVTNARVPGVYSNVLTFAGGSRACMYVCNALVSAAHCSWFSLVASSSRFWK